MLTEWAKVDFRFFDFMIRSLVYDMSQTSELNSYPKHPLGSWKDMKYFLTYMKSELIDSVQPQSHSQPHVFQDYKDIQSQRDLYSKCVNTIVLLVNEQLRADYAIYSEHRTDSISLVAKWIPREKSKKFGWLYYYLTMKYFQHEFPCDQTHPSYERAVNRAFMNYRKMISALNRQLDTPQVKMCEKTWSDIDFSHVTSITTHKQTKSFLNVKQNGETSRYPHDADREGCKYNYEEYLRDVKDGKQKLKGARFLYKYYHITSLLFSLFHHLLIFHIHSLTLQILLVHLHYSYNLDMFLTIHSSFLIVFLNSLFSLINSKNIVL